MSKYIEFQQVMNYTGKTKRYEVQDEMFQIIKDW